MISLEASWARSEDRSLLERGMRKALGSIRLGDVMPQPMVKYQNDIMGFMTEILHIPERTLRWSINPGYETHQWDQTVDPIVEMLEALERSEDVAVEAGTGTQKSYTLAAIYCWFTACWEDSRTFTFAPKEDQLRLYSWMELRRWFWPTFKRHFPLATLTDLKLQMIPGSAQWGVFGYPVMVKAGEEISQHAKGQHARDLLLVYEECQAINWAVLSAGKHTSTAPHNLRCMVGNPSHQQDSLHRSAEEKNTKQIIISGLDHPNVVCDDPEIVPGAVSRKSIETRLEELGEGNPIYDAQVRGISPAQATDAFVQKVWCDEAIARAKDPEQRRILMADGQLGGLGVDVANVEGGDSAAIAKGIGALCTEVEEIKILKGSRVEDAAQLGTLVALYMSMLDVDVRHTGIDPVGVGSSSVNKLREMRLYVQELHGSAAVQTDEDLLREQGRSYVMAGAFGNLRSQILWQGRIDLQHGRVGLPDDPDLVRDLTAIKWKLKNGKLWGQLKEEVVIAIGRSPNKGDAWFYWNWVRHRRPIHEEPESIRAFDPAVLEHEMKEGRKVRGTRPELPADLDPTLVERIV